LNPFAVAVIQARMSSSRLPGKVLKPLAGHPMIWHIVERARRCETLIDVVVATSVEPSDDPLHDFCVESGITCYRGSLDNVLSRYVEVVAQFKCDFFVRITGDTPLIHPTYIDRQLKALKEHDGDLIDIGVRAPVLDGQSVHSARSIALVARNSDNPDDLEHMGSPYFAEHPDQFRTIGLSVPQHLSDPGWRLTVDEEADYQLMSKLYEALWDGTPIGIETAMKWLEQHPEAAAINQNVQHSAINKALDSTRSRQHANIKAQVDWST